MGMMDSIRKVSVSAVGVGNPVNIMIGEVLSVEDLKIKVEQKFILEKNFLIMPESLTKYEVDLKHIHDYVDNGYNSVSTNQTEKSLLNPLVIREGLKIGDTVLLVRIQGGQQYVILDKVV